MMSYKIGNLLIREGGLLAPMAGFSNVAVRSLAAKLGASITYTEMVSAKGLHYSPDKSAELLLFTPDEKIKACQLFGSDKDFLQKAIDSKYIEPFDIVDINFGCPVNKIVRNGEGSALLQDPSKIYEIISHLSKNSKKPITAKVRRGFKNGEDNLDDVVIALEDAGASAITIHGRYQEQLYSGKSDRDCIKRACNLSKIPVFASGDIFTVEDFNQVVKYTGAETCMIARGGLGNYSLFEQILNQPLSMTKQEQMLYIIDRMIDYYSRERSVKMLRSILSFFYKKEVGGARVRVQINKAENIKELKEIIRENKC